MQTNEHTNKVNEQEELLVHKLNSSILVDMKRMSKEIISGIQTAAYDILQKSVHSSVSTTRPKKQNPNVNAH